MSLLLVLDSSSQSFTAWVSFLNVPVNCPQTWKRFSLVLVKMFIRVTKMGQLLTLESLTSAPVSIFISSCVCHLDTGSVSRLWRMNLSKKIVCWLILLHVYHWPHCLPSSSTYKVLNNVLSFCIYDMLHILPDSAVEGGFPHNLAWPVCQRFINTRQFLAILSHRISMEG